MIPAHRHDQVIALPLLGEIFLRVIDDMVRPKRACLVHIPRTTHGRDLRSERLSDLHGKGSYASRGTLNQDLLSGSNMPFISQSLQGGDGRYRDGRRRLIRGIGGLEHKSVFSSARKFGKSPMPHPKDIVPDLKLCDVGANPIYTPCEIYAESRVLGLAQPTVHGAKQERLPTHGMPVQGIDRRRVNLYQYFT